eukprot:1772983-Prymnesium_polylepis.2
MGRWEPLMCAPRHAAQPPTGTPLAQRPCTQESALPPRHPNPGSGRRKGGGGGAEGSQSAQTTRGAGDGTSAGSRAGAFGGFATGSHHATRRPPARRPHFPLCGSERCDPR